VGRGAAPQGAQVRPAVDDAARPVAQLTWRLILGAAALALLLCAPSSAEARNRWLGDKVLNMAHQGGEAEFPSNTMYAFRKALALGADTLELDVSATRDGKLVVMHDWQVDRTTNGHGYLTDLTLAQVRKLDAAYNFVPGRNAVPGLPASRYPFRGIRTGDRKPPKGYTRNDFRVPTLAEVLRAFPHTPINIEIKGRDDAEAQFLHNADLLADLLRSTRRKDLIVVSFNQNAVDRFHTRVPQVDVAPGINGIARFLLGGASPGPGTVALQVPITYELNGQTLQVTTPQSVLQSHRAGYAVHVWLSNDEENARVYDRLLDMCVDGIMAAKPRLLERRLRRRHVVRPDGRGTDPCSVRARRRSTVRKHGVAIALLRRGREPKAYSGTVRIRARGRLVGREHFRLAAGVRSGGVTVPLTRAGRRLLAAPGALPARVAVTTRGARGRPVLTRIRLG
jgi:glycerophosphoryl diester phosphodiesterase